MKKWFVLFLFSFIVLVFFPCDGFSQEEPVRTTVSIVTLNREGKFENGGTAFFIEPVPGVCNFCIQTAEHIASTDSLIVGRRFRISPFDLKDVLNNLNDTNSVEAEFVTASKDFDIALLKANSLPFPIKPFGLPLIKRMFEGQRVWLQGVLWTGLYDNQFSFIYYTFTDAQRRGEISRLDMNLADFGKSLGVNWNKMNLDSAQGTSGTSGSPIFIFNVFGERELVGIHVGSVGSWAISVRLQDIREFLESIRPDSSFRSTLEVAKPALTSEQKQMRCASYVNESYNTDSPRLLVISRDCEEIRKEIKK